MMPVLEWNHNIHFGYAKAEKTLDVHVELSGDIGGHSALGKRSCLREQGTED